MQQFERSFGTATVCYPEAAPERCTAALLLDVDAVRLARSRSRSDPDFSLAQYVNDRSYAASSLLAVVLADVFSTARSGRCRSRQELADSTIPLEIAVPVLPCRGGADIARRLFEPLGWAVSAEPIPLDDELDWGPSRYVDLRLVGTLRLADALNQLYVLLPVLDESKHYWQGSDEVDKLLRSGEGWLVAHPDADLIAQRYLGRHRDLTRVASARLAELSEEADDESEGSVQPAAEEDVAQPVEQRIPLNRQRHDAVHDILLGAGAQTVIDLGCGSGAFLQRLVATPSFTRVAGTDVSTRSLRSAARRLHLDRMSERQAARVELFQSALTYQDERYAGFDAAVLMEVIEHVDPSRLPALEHVVFGVARPRLVVVTTPNADYNPIYQGLQGYRHPDHRFEWGRDEFATWTDRVATAYGYRVERHGVGERHDTLGQPTQLAVFHSTETEDD